MFNDSIILLIDDDSWMQKVLSKIINRIEINTIYTASNGFEGVNLAIEKKPNAIFLDLIMPDINGLTTLRMLKSIKVTRDIPIIIITSNSDFESIGSVLASGASEFVAKPFSFATIQEKLIKVLSNAKEQFLVKNQNSNNNIVYNSSSSENDEFDFLNSFILEANLDKFDEPESVTRTTYKNIGNTYQEPEAQINKILNK